MELILRDKIKEALKNLYNCDVSEELIQVQETRKDFKGDFTLVVFPLLRFSKNTPESTADSIGKYLVDNFDEMFDYSSIGHFDS